MSPAADATKVCARPPADDPPNVLRIHGGAGAQASSSWADLTGDFLDSAAKRRLEHYLRAHAGHRWKPRIALVLPASFSAARPSHRRDLTAALELLAPVADHYNLEIVSDSPDAASLFPSVSPYSPSLVASCAGALVLLSRSLAAELASIKPARYVAADPCAHRANQKRLVFTAGSAPDALPTAGFGDVARAARGCIPVFLDDDDDSPQFLEALGRLRGLGIPLRISLSSRADDEFAGRVHQTFDRDPRVSIRDSEPTAGLDDLAAFQVSNDPLALLTQRGSNLPRFLYHRGGFRRVGDRPAQRRDFYLLRGEEADPRRVLESWLHSPSRTDRAQAPTPGADPLVSIVVPVYDRTSEIVRLAHSIYEQDYPWIEVVFSCNGSPPETLEAVRVAENYLMKRRFSVRVREMPHACGCATIPRDYGIRSSTGDLICLLDSDDWLDHQFFHFLRHGQWRDDTLYYPKRIFRDHGRVMRPGFPFNTPLSGLGNVENDDLGPALRRHGNFMCNSGVCFSRTLFDRAGGIDHRLTYGEDLYLWWRCARAGARAQEHDGRVNVALHPGNNELAVGQESRLSEATDLANAQEMTQWL